mmetsp:Transcript_29051/g.52198  ORF Transcript_29051/g.52198 Transcript_29051/m.52198 type:complete len:129 (+) Transcript_29051:2344-2730(+)
MHQPTKRLLSLYGQRCPQTPEINPKCRHQTFPCVILTKFTSFTAWPARHGQSAVCSTHPSRCSHNECNLQPPTLTPSPRLPLLRVWYAATPFTTAAPQSIGSSDLSQFALTSPNDSPTPHPLTLLADS